MLLQNTFFDGNQGRQAMQKPQSLHSQLIQPKEDELGKSLEVAW